MNFDTTLLEKISSTGSRLLKEELLALANEDTKHFIKLALDPDITFGVTVEFDEYNGPNLRETLNKSAFWKKMAGVLDKLRVRELTGNAAKNEIDDILHKFPSELDLLWACRVINRNLRAGFDIRTYNAVFGAGKIEKFAVQLADVYDGQELSGLYQFQPKLDGNRVIMKDGLGWSRNGKEYKSQGVTDIINEVTDHDPDFFKKWVLDGEMMGDLGFDQSSGALRRISEGDRKQAKFTYWVFDMISREQWEKKETVSLLARQDILTTWITDARPALKSIKLVPTVCKRDPSHDFIMKLCDDYIAAGFEGAMAKDARSPYVFKRGKNVLKVKRFKDADLKVVDMYEGKGKHKGRLGGIIVEGKIGKDVYRSEVGSGFNDSTREEIWNNKKKFLGRIAQVQYQELTPAPKLSLRFPVFCMFRNDKE